VTTSDRTDATDSEFAPHLARWEAADYADESAVGQVAQALMEPMPEWRGGPDVDYWRMRAERAIAALRGPSPADETPMHGCCPNGQHVCCCGLCGDDR
jgi:hypothetical protein